MITRTTRNTRIAMALLGCLLGLESMAQQHAFHPNILWITTEDMSPQLGAYGDGVARTPNIDRLAEEGIRYYPDTPIVREDIARNYDNIARMDAMVGNVLAELEEDGLLEETIVFFFSDHGSGLPRAKRWMYDSGIHVPLIVRFPHGERAGAVVDRLVSFIDFAPTVLSLAGVPIPEYLHGTAFLGPAEGPERRYVHAARDRMDPALDTRRAVRDARYKYIRNYRPERPYLQFLPYRDQMPLMQEILRLKREGGLDSTRHWQLISETKPLQELYDTWEDPHEINNLAGEPRYRNKLLELRREQERWFDAIDDMGLIPEPVLKNMLYPPYGEQPVTTDPEIHTAPARGGVMVRLTSSTDGASIGYRIGTDETWHVYERPVFVPAGKPLSAVAHRIGYAPSAEVRSTFERAEAR